MSDDITRCPSCGRRNRVPAVAAGTPRCGSCHEPLPWITDAVDPVSTEFRDDRFTAAFDRKRGDPAVFTVAYVVRAVSLGKYVRPQASVEDMYRPERYGRSETGAVEVVAGK